MGEMRDSDWSRPKMLRSDWLGLIGAIMTTNSPETKHFFMLELKIVMIEQILFFVFR